MNMQQSFFDTSVPDDDEPLDELPGREDIKQLGRVEARRRCAVYGHSVSDRKLRRALRFISTRQARPLHAGAWDTERLSAELAKGSSVSLNQAILLTIVQSPAGDAEVARRLSRLKLSVGAARNSLMMEGLVEATAERRSTGHGQGIEVVWRATALGCEVAGRL